MENTTVEIFDTTKEDDCKTLQVFFDFTNEEANKNIYPALEQMIEWVKSYVTDNYVTKTYKDELSLKLAAEATWWCDYLGLDKYFQYWSFSMIRQFRPLEMEMGFHPWDVGKNSQFIDKLKSVCEHLKVPAMSHHASYALGQAAWICHFHHHPLYIPKNDVETVHGDPLKEIPASVFFEEPYMLKNIYNHSEFT